MPMTLQLDAVNFGFHPVTDQEGSVIGMALSFTDPSGVARILVPFAQDAWENFKRQVAADGAISPIAIARNLNGVPQSPEKPSG